METNKSRFSWKILLFVPAIVLFTSSVSSSLRTDVVDKQYTNEFHLEGCVFKSEGENPYFILKPGYQLLLEGIEDGKTVRFLMTVLDETKDLEVPGIGMVTTRVVEEKEWADGKPVEFARSFFAICEKTNDVVDFGDEVDIFMEDGTVTHDGTWHAGKKDNDGVAEPGIFMPGTFLLGAKYYQQLANGMSMERGENVEMEMTVDTGAGQFDHCVMVLETNTAEGDASTAKTHCLGIGLVGEDDLKLIQYGYNIVDENGNISEK